MVTLIQGPAKGTGTTAASFTVTLGAQPTSGNLLILTFLGMSDGINAHVTSITQTNVVWTAVVQINDNQACEIWKGVVNASAGTVITVNVTDVDADSFEIADVCEWSGLDGTVDKTASNGGGLGTTTDSGTTAATTQANELAVASLAATKITDVDNSQSSPTNGYTLLDGVAVRNAGNAHWMSLGYAYKILSAMATQNTSTTLAASSYWAGCIATFKAAAGGTLQTVTDSLSLSDAILRHKTVLPITDVLGLADAVLRNKTFTIADSVGASDVARSNKSPLIVTDVVSLVDLINVITGAILKTVADAIGVSDMALINKSVLIADVVGVLDQVFRHKPVVSVADVVSAVETVLAIKLLTITDSVGLADVLKVLKTLNVSDTLTLADAVSTPSRVLRALDQVGLADGALVNKVLQVTENISLVEVVEVGTGGVAKKTKLFLVLGDLAIQLCG